MKSTEFKKIIKEAVKEAIQEEIKDILLEAVRAPRISPVAVMQESFQPTSPTLNSNPQMDAAQRKNMYEQALNSTSLSLNSSNAQTFRPQPGFDSSNGSLPGGEVGMDQIMSLMNAR
jgi:hypothetical protein